MKKREGKLEIFISFFALTLLAIVIVVQLQKYYFEATKTYVEDALAASNLASAVVDIQEYGISHNVVISDISRAYSYYLDALKYNLELNVNWEHANKALISGKVKVKEYRVYNVLGNDVEIFMYDETGTCSHSFYENGLGSVTAPNGKIIENTSIYSRITFPVNAIWEISVEADKDNLVDITQK